MYPRAEAYIISVKQSTYCQFGEVIRAHRQKRVVGGAAVWRDGEREGERETAEKIREK